MKLQTWRGVTLALMLGVSAGALAQTACAPARPPLKVKSPGTISSGSGRGLPAAA